MEAIINEMRAAVAPGQQDLDAAAVSRRRELTARLVAGRREEARTEYERFLSVIKRELCLPRDQLAERLDGAVILVTGGTGCVGSTLITQLAAFRPARIVSVSRGVTRGWPRHPGAEYLYADVRDQARMEALIGEIRPDLIFHVASQRDPGLAETLVHHTVTTNVLGTRSVLGAAAAAGTGQVVCASTGKALRPFSPDVYTASKRVAEWVAFGFAASGALPVSAVRFTHVVDNSIIHQRLQDWAASSAVIRLHSPQIAFYVQSAVESAQLLMLAALDQGRAGPAADPCHRRPGLAGQPARPHPGRARRAGFRRPRLPQRIRPRLRRGAVPRAVRSSDRRRSEPVAERLRGGSRGAVGVSDDQRLRGRVRARAACRGALRRTGRVCGETDDPQRVRAALRELSWALLDATLAVAPPEALTRAARIANRHVATLTADHGQILRTIQKWGSESSNLAVGEAGR